jgi:hypothetical protein
MIKLQLVLIAFVSLSTFTMAGKGLATEKTKSLGRLISNHPLDRTLVTIEPNSIDRKKVVSPMMTALLDTKTQLIRAKNLKKYTHQNNLFSISIPSDWSKKDTSKPDDTIVTFD